MTFARTEVQMVSIPQQEALTLVAAFLDGRTSQAAFDHVQDLLAEGRATIDGRNFSAIPRCTNNFSIELQTEGREHFAFRQISSAIFKSANRST